MNRASIILGLALVVAAVAPSRAPEQKKIPVSVTQQTAWVSQTEKIGTYTVTEPNTMQNKFSYSLQFTQQDGKTGGLTSGNFLESFWDGIAYDRESTEQCLQRLGVWDSVREGSEITLTIPDADIAQVDVRFDPNTVYNDERYRTTSLATYAPQSINMTPDASGELHRCSFPVSFQPVEGAKSYNQVFCVIHVTFQDGNSGDIGLALTKIL